MAGDGGIYKALVELQQIEQEEEKQGARVEEVAVGDEDAGPMSSYQKTQGVTSSTAIMRDDEEGDVDEKESKIKPDKGLISRAVKLSAPQ